MSTFPSLIPNSINFDFGTPQISEYSAFGIGPIRFRHTDFINGQTFSLKYQGLDQASIDQSVLDKELELVTEELKNSGKPEEITKKISLGKMSKFKEENALLTQAWVMEPKKKVQDILKELSISDLKIKEFVRFKIGD